MRKFKPFAIAAVLLIALLAVGVALAARKANEPADVPDSFVAPTESSTTTQSIDALSTTPSTTTATGPNDNNVVFNSNRTGNFEVFRFTNDGSIVQLTHDKTSDAWWPRPSPDRERILFNRTPAGVHDSDSSQVSLWLMNADGTGQQLLRPPGLDGWTQQGHAEWAPDGTRIVMFGGSRLNPQIYVTNAVGQDPVNVTKRDGTNIDPSFAPDGKHVVFIGCPRAICFPSDYEVFITELSSNTTTRITNDKIRDQDPYFSFDGANLAWLSEFGSDQVHDAAGVWDIQISDSTGENAHRLLNDNNITSRPIWSRDGKSIFTHRLVRDVDQTFQIVRISLVDLKVDQLTQDRFVNEYPG